MPEQLTKYPDVTLKVLESAGAVCGQGVEQKILKQCPKEGFCSLPGGELCVYGLDQVQNMTQITRQELMDAIAPRVAGSLASPWETIGMVVLFLAGLVLGRMRKRPGRS